mmetsp:Transcript_142294/g.248118  ORF Transcript_142294/g.248118 Transcript_142294/m.248118 type:complete len:93 (-) Transcript_142294:379-657(-)
MSSCTAGTQPWHWCRRCCGKVQAWMTVKVLTHTATIEGMFTLCTRDLRGGQNFSQKLESCPIVVIISSFLIKYHSTFLWNTPPAPTSGAHDL